MDRGICYQLSCNIDAKIKKGLLHACITITLSQIRAQVLQ